MTKSINERIVELSSMFAKAGVESQTDMKHGAFVAILHVIALLERQIELLEKIENNTRRPGEIV